MVNLAADAGQTGTGVLLRLESEADTDDVKRVGEEDGGHPGKGSRRQAAACRLLRGRLDHYIAELLIRQELDSGVGKDA